jgi:hypothetical protein
MTARREDVGDALAPGRPASIYAGLAVVYMLYSSDFMSS